MLRLREVHRDLGQPPRFQCQRKRSDAEEACASTFPHLSYDRPGGSEVAGREIDIVGDQRISSADHDSARRRMRFRRPEVRHLRAERLLSDERQGAAISRSRLIEKHGQAVRGREFLP